MLNCFNIITLFMPNWFNNFCSNLEQKCSSYINLIKVINKNYKKDFNMEKRSLLYFGSAEEIFMFEDWFNSMLLLGPKYTSTLKDAYFSYETFMKTKGMGNSKITKKKLKAFIEDRLKVNGINQPFFKQRGVYVIGFDIKPKFKKVLPE